MTIFIYIHLTVWLVVCHSTSFLLEAVRVHHSPCVPGPWCVQAPDRCFSGAERWFLGFSVSMGVVWKHQVAHREIRKRRIFGWFQRRLIFHPYLGFHDPIWLVKWVGSTTIWILKGCLVVPFTIHLATRTRYGFALTRSSHVRKMVQFKIFNWLETFVIEVL